MPVQNLMARTIGMLAVPPSGNIEYFDEKIPGFGLRVSGKGRRTWFVRYRIKGYQSKGCLTLGTYPILELADARGRARAALRLAEDGQNPAKPVQQIRKAELFCDVAAAFMETFRRHHRSGREKQRILDHDILPAIGATKTAGITRSDVRDMLAKVTERGSPIMANAVLSLTRRIFNWAISEEMGGVNSNPCAHLAQPGKNVSRDRVLSPNETKTLWHALDQTNANVPRKLALALKFQLVTAQRKGEVITAEWAEMELDKDPVWNIPAAKAKNGLAHRVPLSPLALGLLQEAKKFSRNSPWVFPSARKLGYAVTPRAINKAFNAATAAITLADVRPHDLRRTAASQIASLGIPRFVVARILNHVEPGVTSIYDRYGYDREKREALNLWAQRLNETLNGQTEPANVTALRHASNGDLGLRTEGV
ncbi:MAG: tyrosine-type recombinase/integrase [Xanthobacteraceae bacterium]